VGTLLFFIFSEKTSAGRRERRPGRIKGQAPVDCEGGDAADAGRLSDAVYHEEAGGMATVPAGTGTIPEAVALSTSERRFVEGTRTPPCMITAAARR
jgi:hypothetical protein